MLTISARNWFLSEWKQPCERKVQREVEEEGNISVMVQRCPRTSTVNEFPRSSFLHASESLDCYTEMDNIRAVSAFRPAGMLQLDLC